MTQNIKPKIHTVSEINASIARIFEDEPLFSNVYVKGEIGNFSRSKSGHVYFNLKDEKAIISVNVWKFTIEKLDPNLFDYFKEGAKVIVYGKINVYEKGGTYNLIANDIKFYGEGELALQFLKIKKELANIGLFSQEHKQPIKRFNYNVGVITAKTGAVIKDIISTIKRRFPNVSLRIYNSIMQGKDAENDIITNLKLADKNNHDVIIIARGGGSLEDLWVFNSKQLAIEVFNAKTPIISAIGHETDTTIIDYVSDVRAPTPTAAAELINPHINDVKNEVFRLQKTFTKDINNFIGKIKYELMVYDKTLSQVPTTLNKVKTRLSFLEKQFLNISNNFIKINRSKIVNLTNRLNKAISLKIEEQKIFLLEQKHLFLKYIRNIFNEKQNIIKTLDSSLSQKVKNYLKQTKHELVLYEQHLNLLNPEAIFKKGFFYLKQEKQLIKNLKEVKLDQTLVIHSNELKVETKVLKISKNK